MRKLPIYILVLLALYSCKEQYTTYSDAEYVMFADSLSTNMVEKSNSRFTVPIASTVARDYDRTFGVEVVDAGSNAVEGKHYRIISNTVTIPAGKTSANVEVEGIYDNIGATDSLGFRLRLVMNSALKWDLYKDSDMTKVVMYKSCPYDRNNFTGYAVLSSLLLRDYPGENSSYQKVVYTEAHPTEPDMIIIRDAFYNGYDVTLTFDGADPAEPRITMDSDQVLSDEASVFGQILGDNHILGDDSPIYTSYFNSCQRFAVLWLHVYVEDLGQMIGTVGHFYNILEWISDEEAERLKREGF
ncbi:MAG: DUF4984 domain-containing protein [Alistipes sp.]|nr:DUF4984 domain-containing protein [Alistipes sp.]MBQ1200458.1 DUF4984 domain-containing protein [Alistipes sp.]